MGCWLYVRVEDNHQYPTLPQDKKKLVYQRGDVVDVFPDTVPIGGKMLTSGKHWIIELPNVDRSVLLDFLEAAESRGVTVGRRTKKLDLDTFWSSLNGGQKNTLANTGRISFNVSNDQLLRAVEIQRDT